MGKGEIDHGIADYSKAIEINPRYANAYFNRGRACEAKGDHVCAIADFTKAIEITPLNADAYYNRGLAHRANGEIGYAIADYTKAIEINPRRAAAYNSRSNAFEATGDLVPNFTEARVNQFLGFRSQMSHLPTISDTRAPAILGTSEVLAASLDRISLPRIFRKRWRYP